MRIVALFVALSLSLLLCVAAVCQDAPPPAPPVTDDSQAPPPAPVPADEPVDLTPAPPATDDSQAPAPVPADEPVDLTPAPPAPDDPQAPAPVPTDEPVDSPPVPPAADDSQAPQPAPVPADEPVDLTPPPPATDDSQAPPPAPVPADEPVDLTPPPPAPALAPTPWLLQRDKPYVIVGPGNSQIKPKVVKQKITIISKPATGVKLSSVNVMVDDRPIGSALADKMGLYGIEFDTASSADGTHTVKSVGADATGNQVWTAVTLIDIRNKQPIVPPTPVAAARPASAKPVIAAKPTQPAPPGVMLGAPAKTYTSTKHGFSIKQPAGWTAKDKTAAMKPRQAGNGWMEFSAAKNANLVVNVRRMRVEPGTTADVFAKFNPYVAKWERKTLLNAEAFSTNTDTGNKMIHRVIILKDGLAWMLNCVDGAGKTSDAGRKLFDSMVASFSVSSKP